MSGNAKRRRETKRERKTLRMPRGFRGVPRAGVPEALALLSADLGPGIFWAEVLHDDGCPCTRGEGGLEACTCATLNVRIGGRLQ